jgi:hypothetical protein
MESQSPLALVIAHYDLRTDAENDLAAVKRFIVDNHVDLYDVELIETDAWDQAAIHQWETPVLRGDGFLRKAFTALYAGRAAAHKGAYAGLPQRELEQIATSMTPDATVLVVGVQTGHPGAFAACFAHASRIAQRDIAPGPDGAYPDVSAALEQLMAVA